MRLSRTRWLASVVTAALAAGVVPVGSWTGSSGLRFSGVGFGPSVALAQNIGQRVVNGFVVDENSNPVAGARVFLKYLKTKSIRSFTSDAAGKFRFTQVNMAEDYELWTEKDGKKSAVKTVSSWDTRKDYECELKLK